MSVPFSSLNTPAPAYDSQFLPSRIHTPLGRPSPGAPSAGGATPKPRPDEQKPGSGTAGVAAMAAPSSSAGSLSIEKALVDYEQAVSQIVQSITSFSPHNDLVSKIVQADQFLGQSVDELLDHQRTQATIKQLETTSKDLDSKLNQILIELADCRRSLQALPKTPAGPVDDSDSDSTRLNAGELLRYATKITKFTSAPPGYSPAAPEHANLPWPSEDELRRGALAIAANEGPAEAETTADPAAATTAAAAAGGAEDANAKPGIGAGRRRSSLVSYGDRPVVEPTQLQGQLQGQQNAVQEHPQVQGGESAVVDLDLFDPDEDDD